MPAPPVRPPARALVLAMSLLLAPLVAGCISAPTPGAGDDEATNGSQPRPRPPTVVFEPQPRVELEPSNTSTDETREEDEYWMVRVRGHETRESKPGRADAVCSILWSHEVDEEARAVSYERSQHAFDPDEVRVLAAFDHFARWDSCPIAYTLHPNASVEEDMGRYGPLAFVVHRDGTVELHGGTFVPLGQRARVTYEGTMTTHDGESYVVNGTFTVENLGAWLQADLQPA